MRTSASRGTGERRPGRLDRSAAALVRTLVLLAFLAVAALSSAPVLFAHDFWIEPDTFHPAVGTFLPLRLRVGQDFQGDPVPRNESLVARFVLVQEGKESPVSGQEGDDPAGVALIGRPGVHVAGFRSRPSPIELEAPKFEKYLADEGLESVIAARARRGESAKPGKEIFSRCAKTVIEAGRGGKPGFDRRLGFTLELVPLGNPYALKPGATLAVQLLFQDKPLEGALVVAMNEEDASAKLTARSDRAGRVSFRLPRPGVWLVKAVHMVPAPRGSSADWESLWASLTFEAPGTP